MSFEDALKDISAKVSEFAGSLETEEATKNALIMPFIARVLGYDVFNPQEVIPEFVADVGSRKGEKVDYAIMKDGSVQMLIEAKAVGASLTLENAAQLTRYFTVCSARIGVLTNGQHWLFYTDLDKPNIMDAKPFLRLDLSNLDAHALPELKKLTREAFDLDSVLAAAEELKYVSALKAELAKEFAAPSVDLVKLLGKRVYDTPFTAKIQATFEGIVAKALRQYINDQVDARLKTALEGTRTPSEPPVAQSGDTSDDAYARDPIETTVEELEAFMIVRAILASEVEVGRIVARDRQSYFGVLLDDNNRKPICRFHFNSQSVKYIGIIGSDKQETKHQIFSTTDIYKFTDELRAAIKQYD